MKNRIIRIVLVVAILAVSGLTVSMLAGTTTVHGPKSTLLTNVLTDTYLFVGNGSNVATGVVVSGDVTISNAGAVTIGNDKIDSQHYVDGSVDLAHMAPDSVDGTKIVDDAVDSEHYTDASIDLAHMAPDSVDGSKIVDDAIDSEHYATGSIDLTHLAGDSVDGTKIVDNAIDTVHYTDSSIDNVHLTGLITEDKRAAAATQTISADDQEIAHNDKAVVLLTLSGAAATHTLGTAASAIADGSVDGQKLRLIIHDNGATDEIQILDNPPTSNTKMQGDWHTGSDENFIDFTWNATDSNWWETGRGSRNSLDGLNAGAVGGSGSDLSGNFSGSAGGQSHTLSGYAAGAVGGLANNVMGDYAAAAGGRYGRVAHAAEVLLASYRRSATGDNQVSSFIAYGTFTAGASEHTTPVWHELVSPARWVLQASRTVGFTVTIIGRRDGTPTDSAMFKRMILITRDGANNTAIVGAVQAIGTDIAPANWSVQLTADDTNESIKIEVHGADNDGDIHWSAHIMPHVVG